MLLSTADRKVTDRFGRVLYKMEVVVVFKGLRSGTVKTHIGF